MPAALTSHLRAAFFRPSLIRLTLSKLDIEPELISPLLTDLFSDLFILFFLQLSSHAVSSHHTCRSNISPACGFLSPSLIRLTLSKLNIDLKVISPSYSPPPPLSYLTELFTDLFILFSVQLTSHALASHHGCRSNISPACRFLPPLINLANIK